MTPELLNDFKLAPSGEGSLADEWRDKPHRLVYDLVKEIERLQSALDEMVKEYHAAINEEAYAGTRLDWIHRCENAEAQVEKLQAENRAVQESRQFMLEIAEERLQRIAAIESTLRETRERLAREKGHRESLQIAVDTHHERLREKEQEVERLTEQLQYAHLRYHTPETNKEKA